MKREESTDDIDLGIVPEITVEEPVVIPVKKPKAVSPVKSDEFEQDGIRFRRIHRLEGNRWIDRCERIG